MRFLIKPFFESGSGEFAGSVVLDGQGYRRSADSNRQNISTPWQSFAATERTNSLPQDRRLQSLTQSVEKQPRQIKGRPSKAPQKFVRQVKKYKGESLVNLRRRGGGRKLLDDDAVEALLTSSPQLSVEGVEYPLLSTLLSPLPLGPQDRKWIESHGEEVKEAAGFPPHSSHVEGQEEAVMGELNSDSSEPVDHLDDLLYLCFMHRLVEMADPISSISPGCLF